MIAEHTAIVDALAPHNTVIASLPDCSESVLFEDLANLQAGENSQFIQP